MKRTILIIIFSVITIGSTYSQWIQSFENLGMYRVQISGLVNDEQALYVSRLINECNNVLIARATLEGECKIFTEGEISFNEIFEKLASVQNIQIGERYSVKPTKEDFIETYNNFKRFPANDPEKSFPAIVKYKDPQKEARAMSVMKTLWIEKYPNAYKTSQPDVIEEMTPVKNQNENEMSNPKNN